MFVWILDAEVSNDEGDYAGIRKVYDGPTLAADDLQAWLFNLEIDIDEAFAGKTETTDSICNDVFDLSGPWAGCVLSWGINRYEVISA
jgi:hypothetical protein